MIAFLLLCLTMELTPGPNMAYLAMVGASDGRKAGISAVAGIALGLMIVGTMAVLGVAELVRYYPSVGQGLVLLGVLYLLWLAFQSWQEGAELSPDRVTLPDTRTRYFTRGLITNLLNPKAFVFYTAVLPGFASTHAPTTITLFSLTAISVTIATIIHLMIVLLASQFQTYLANATRRRIVRRVMALLLVAVAVWFVGSNASMLFKKVA